MVRRLRLKESNPYAIGDSGSAKLIKVVDAYATFPDSERYSVDEDYTNVLNRYYSTITDLAFDVSEKTPFSSDIKDYYADPDEPGNIIVLNAEDYVGILTIKIEVLKYCEPTLNDIRSFNIRIYSESLSGRTNNVSKNIKEDISDDSEYFGVFESGGSIGENSKRKGLPTIHTPHGAAVLIDVYDNQEDAKTSAKRLRKNWGGGYYDYHYFVRKIKPQDAQIYFDWKENY